MAMKQEPVTVGKRLMRAFLMLFFGLISAFVFLVALSSIHIVLPVWAWILFISAFVALGFFMPWAGTRKSQGS